MRGVLFQVSISPNVTVYDHSLPLFLQNQAETRLLQHVAIGRWGYILCAPPELVRRSWQFLLLLGLSTSSRRFEREMDHRNGLVSLYGVLRTRNKCHPCSTQKYRVLNAPSLSSRKLIGMKKIGESLKSLPTYRGSSYRNKFCVCSYRARGTEQWRQSTFEHIDYTMPGEVL